MKRAIQLIAISAATAACTHAAIPPCGKCPFSQATGGAVCMTRGALALGAAALETTQATGAVVSMTRGALTLGAAVLGFAGTAFCSHVPSACGMSSDSSNTATDGNTSVEEAEDDTSEETLVAGTA